MKYRPPEPAIRNIYRSGLDFFGELRDLHIRTLIIRDRHAKLLLEGLMIDRTVSTE
jgi:hypothetical protein